MSAAKHTPGPWRIATDSNGTRAKHIMADSHATVCSFLTSVCRSCEPEQINANARLIEAAPELLDALDRLASAAERREYPMGDPCALLAAQAGLRDAIQHARDTMARATGRTS